MKKLLSFSSSKIYLISGLALMMTLGSFWHHQMNQTQLDRMNILNQGVGTCFNRVSQTFTAMMIKEMRSPYLNRGFMALSDECLNETIKGINPFRKNVGKGYETLNQLISEVHWFHEKVMKIHAPMLAGQNLNVPLSPLTERYTKMENYKVDLMDEIDAANYKLREVQMNDEVLMGAGLILFVLSLSLLSLKEFNRMQVQRDIEREALNFLKAGKTNVGAIVDQLVDRALTTQGMIVTAQIFRDYHEDMMEKGSLRTPKATEPKTEDTSHEVTQEVEAAPAEEAYTGHKTSLKEILVSIQNIQSKDSIHMSEVRDVQLNVPYESFEQMINSAINQLAARRIDNKKIMISNQIHSDRSVVNLFLKGSTFNANELEFAEGKNAVAADGIDMNLVILKEMVMETGAQWYLENKADRNGTITGMNIRFTAPRAPKERSKLVSVFRGKKKDLQRELLN
jgi:hypothetical protein